MLSPVREDTLGFHLRQLSWMRYPFAALLLANISCVLYAVARPTPEPPPSQTLKRTVTTAASESRDEGELVLISEEQAQKIAIEQATANGSDLSESRESTDDRMSSPLTRDSILANLRRRQQDSQANRNNSQSTVPANEGRSPSDFSMTTVDDNQDNAGDGKPSELDKSESDVETDFDLHIVITNPESNTGAVSFLLNGEVTTLAPGESKVIPADNQTKANVMFHRGGKFGDATEVISAGEHSFQITKQGWLLSPEGP